MKSCFKWEVCTELIPPLGAQLVWISACSFASAARPCCHLPAHHRESALSPGHKYH